MAKNKKDKRITKLYVNFNKFMKELCVLVEEKGFLEVCSNATEMNEKYIADNLKRAKIGMYDVLTALSRAEDENKNQVLFKK